MGSVRERLETDQTRCHVTLVMPHGPFARLAEGVEGLIHVTELGAERAADPAKSTHAGDVIRVQILAIDRERRRLSLSARRTERT